MCTDCAEASVSTVQGSVKQRGKIREGKSYGGRDDENMGEMHV